MIRENEINFVKNGLEISQNGDYRNGLLQFRGFEIFGKW